MEKQKPKPPPPPPKVEKKKPKKKEKPKEKKKEVKKKPKPKPKPKPKEKSQAEKVAEARKKAQSTGLLAMADELSELRDTTPKLNKSKKLSKGATQAKTVKRNILTSNQVASAGSGGINTDELSSGIGSTQLAGRQTTQVESPVEKVAKQARIESSNRKDKKPSRTYEEVSLVFDKNKGAIYSIYNRALRKDPTLEGKLVIEITISPSGQVTDVKVVSSELDAPELEQKLLTRISLFNFGAKDVEQLIVTYPIDFLPP
jgi:TonB family protein